MWCYVTANEALPGAHSAIVDARAQCTIVADDRFQRYMDKPVAMIAMTDVAELKRKVPTGWTEGVEGSAWKLQRDKEYDYAGGGRHGPSLAARTCCEAQSLADLFLFFFPLPLLQTIAQETNRYGNVRVPMTIVLVPKVLKMRMMMMIKIERNQNPSTYLLLVQRVMRSQTSFQGSY
jgi:hypothetical protein